MINLLPPAEKEKLLLEQKKRLITILWILALFFIFCLILILFSIKFYIQGQVKSQKIILQEVEKELEQSGIRDLQEKINTANLTLIKLNDFYQNKIRLIEILERISNTLPPETYLTNLSAVFFDTDEEAGFKMSLSGFASTREFLFDFKKNLEREKGFKEVYFPPVNWVKAVDVNFSVTFKVNDR